MTVSIKTEASMSADRLEEIAARHEAATPGRWWPERDYADVSDDALAADVNVELTAIGPFRAHGLHTDGWVYGPLADVVFAAHAVDDVAYLLEIAQAARAYCETEAAEANLFAECVDLAGGTLVERAPLDAWTELHVAKRDALATLRDALTCPDASTEEP